MSVNPIQSRSHRLAEASYSEAISLLASADDEVGEHNYQNAINILDDALEELLVMREHLERLAEQADRSKR